MEELKTLSVPKITRKRKPLAGETEAAPAELKKPKVWDFFEERQRQEIASVFSGSVGLFDFSIKNADTHFVLHMRGLGNLVSLHEFEKAANEFNEIYEFRDASFDLEHGAIDTRFRLHVCAEHVQPLSNVIQVADVYEPPDLELDFSSPRGLNALLVARVMSHAHSVSGAVNLDYSLCTADGYTVTGDGKTAENKTLRTSNLLSIKGYKTLDYYQLLSFQQILPFHVHSVAVDFKSKTLQMEIQPYAKPLFGLVVPLRTQVGFFFSFFRQGASASDSSLRP